MDREQNNKFESFVDVTGDHTYSWNNTGDPIGNHNIAHLPGDGTLIGPKNASGLGGDGWVFNSMVLWTSEDTLDYWIAAYFYVSL